MIKTYLFLAGTGTEDPFASSAGAAADRLAQLCPQALGYVQTRTLAEQLQMESTPAYQGAAELWFEGPDAAMELAADPARLAPMWAGNVRVAAAVTGHERIVMRRPEHHRFEHIKGVFPFRRKPGMTVAEFQRTWLRDHGPIAACTQDAALYVQCHPLLRSYDGGEPVYDGVTELHWPDVDAARAAMRSRQMRIDQARDAERFVEPGSVLIFLAREEIVNAP